DVMIYIDLNPFRARKVRHPKEYQFSSYGYYAHGKEDLLIDPPEIYLALGKTPATRQKAYREMVEFVIRKDGDKKRGYSYTYFIGNPNWMLRKHRELTEAFHLKRSKPQRK